MSRHFLATLVMAAILPIGGARSEEPVDEGAELTIGVAPFHDGSAPSASATGTQSPDVAAALVDALRALSVSRVVAPAELGAPTADDLDAAHIREIAQRANVGAIIVGRTTQLGSRLSVDVRLRSGRTGEIAGTYVAEIAAAESVQSVTETLAERLVESALALERREREGAGPAVASVTPMSAQTAEVPSPESVPDPAPIAFDALDSDEPLSIRSDELEATDQEGARTLIFRDHVEVDRGDLQLRTDWLKAFYPPGAKQPSLLSARGGVSVAQGDRRAQCDEAEYEQESERIFCRGNTELRDGSDRIRGDRIVFNLAKRSVRVEGDVQIFLYSTHLDANRDADDAEPGTEGATDLLALESDAPLSIHSDRLEAFDRQGRREIMFNGNVEVVRSDVTLRSQQLEAIYSDQQRQPERLVATGDVMVTQGEREARCERAVYFGAEDRVECSGDAELRDGEDRVRGEMIAFDLATETVVVKGRTRLLFHPEQEPTEVAIP